MEKATFSTSIIDWNGQENATFSAINVFNKLFGGGSCSSFGVEPREAV